MITIVFILYILCLLFHSCYLYQSTGIRSFHLFANKKNIFYLQKSKSIVWNDFLPFNYSHSMMNDLDISKLIQYEDNEILVVYKPNTIATQADQGISSNDAIILFDELKKIYNQSIYLIHRIDQPCSGLLVFAKNKVSANTLYSYFRNSDNQLEKSYLLIVNGRIEPFDQFKECTYMIEKTENSKVRLIDLNEYEELPAKQKQVFVPAKLSYRSLQTFIPKRQEVVIPSTNDDSYQSLVEVKLFTGRKHQIRATFSLGLKHSICGDVKYGSFKFRTRDIALHSYKLCFPHPMTKTNMTFLSLPPSIWIRRFGRDVIETINERLMKNNL